MAFPAEILRFTLCFFELFCLWPVVHAAAAARAGDQAPITTPFQSAEAARLEELFLKFPRASGPAPAGPPGRLLEGFPWAEAVELQAHRETMKQVLFSRDNTGLLGGAGVERAALREVAGRVLRHRGSFQPYPRAAITTARGGDYRHQVSVWLLPLALQMHAKKS